MENDHITVRASMHEATKQREGEQLLLSNDALLDVSP